jgi:nitroreductase
MEKKKKYNPVPLPTREPMSDAQMQDVAEEFYQLMKSRHTVRDFSSKLVAKEIIEKAILTAGTAPNGANRQPWHFAVLGDVAVRKTIRVEAEKEEVEFYKGKAGEAWLDALAPLGTDKNKPFLETAPWLIVVFAQRYELAENGQKSKNYYVTESVGIACGLLLTALHSVGLATLTHTPSPMGFLNKICNRPDNEKPLMIIVAGYAKDGATIPSEAMNKKPLKEISSFVK